VSNYQDWFGQIVGTADKVAPERLRWDEGGFADLLVAPKCLPSHVRNFKHALKPSL
jgi:hypothetical protein